MSINSYIESLSVPEANLSANSFPNPEAKLGAIRSTLAGSSNSAKPTIPTEFRAAVNVGSLLSFVDRIQPPERDDVLFSVQLAQRGASGAFNRFSQTESWYKKSLEVLENLGWTAEQFAFAKYEQKEGELRMDKAALSAIAAIATQNQLATLQHAIRSFEALAENDNNIRLFDFHSSEQGSGNFQIGAVQRGENGALSLAMGAFYFRSSDRSQRFLFFSWRGQSVDFWTAAQKMTLNTEFYGQCRDAVRRKLGASASDFIGTLTLN